MSERQPLSTEYWRFWFSAAVSNLGDGIRNGAMPLLALTLTDDARLISGVVVASLSPWFILGPIGGVIVDRADRRRLMIAGQLVRAALVAGLTAAVLTGTATIWMVIIVAFGLGAGEIVVDASSQAAIPNLVEPEQLERANGNLIAAMTVLDQVVGVTLGAVLFAVVTELPFAVDAATFLLGALALSTIKRPLQGERSEAASLRAEMAEGFRFLFGHPLLRGLAYAVALANLAIVGSFSVLVILIVSELGAPEAAFGVVLGIGAVGGLIGSLIAGRVVDRFGRGPVLRINPALTTLALAVVAIAPNVVVVAAAYFVASLAIVLFNVPGRSLRQAVTPDHLLGRVVTVFRMVAMGTAPLGALLAGIIAETSGVRVAMGAAAASMVVAVVAMILALRHLPSDEDGDV